MNDYKEIQRGGVIGISLFASILVLILGAIYKKQMLGITSTSFFVFSLSLLVIYLLFSSLKTVIEEGKIKLSFGIGLIKKGIPVSSISTVTVVRNKWYYGWGIRFYGKGWMWNYTGLDAVEINFKNRKSNFRIGSKQAEELKASIEQQLAKVK